MPEMREGTGVFDRTVRLVIDSTVGTLIVLAHVLISERQAKRSMIAGAPSPRASQRGRDGQHHDGRGDD